MKPPKPAAERSYKGVTVTQGIPVGKVPRHVKVVAYDQTADRLRSAMAIVKR